MVSDGERDEELGTLCQSKPPVDFPSLNRNADFEHVGGAHGVRQLRGQRRRDAVKAQQTAQVMTLTLKPQNTHCLSMVSGDMGAQHPDHVIALHNITQIL